MSKRWLSTAACIALLAWSAPPAAAGTPAQDAQERFQEGNRLFKAGNYDAARVAYEQSAALVARGSTLRNLALTEMKLGDPVRALRHLRKALSAPDLDPNRRGLTQQDLDEAYAATGHLAVTAGPGASVRVDGAAVEGVAPFGEPIDVMPGKHAVEALLAGQSAKAEVDAKAGAVVSVDVSIAQAPVPPVAPVPAATAPEPIPSTPRSPDVAEPNLPPSSTPEPYWIPRREIGLVVAGAGVVAIGAGAYFFSQASSEQTRAGMLGGGVAPGACATASPPAACNAQQQARSSQQSDATLSRVLIDAGGALVVGAAAIVLWPASTSSRTAVEPLVSPYGGGLQLRGEF